ncbi:MAG TPA: outer membrane beta-barrel protein [Verrucomicrobiota bacterium]|jgi:hypothetical protein|nr:outer membrane beta-barrel protein [Verrucomicrobiota bacterium]
MNKWTLALAAAGIVSMAAVASAEEADNQVLTAVSGTTISGYVDTSMNWQIGDKKTSIGRSNDAWNRQNGFNLNAVKVGVGKALEEDASVWAAGYQADLLFGDDANMFSQTTVDFVLQNAYVDLRAPLGNGLDFRAGVFESVVGYESSDSYLNPNFSRSYGFAIQPRQHTGVLASYSFDLNDWILGVRGGVANTYDGWAIYDRGSNSGRLTYMGAVNLIFPESTGFMEGTEVYFGVVSGIDNGWVSSGTTSGWDTANVVNYYAGITMPLPVTGLRFGFSYDYRGQSERTDDAGVMVTRSAWANAFAAYLAYDVTDKLTLANRVEYANGVNGSWGYYLDDAIGLVGGLIPPGIVPSVKAASDRDDEYLSNTFTVSYKLWENVITRAEFRWDHDLSGDKNMADDWDRKNAFGITGNIVYVF